MRDQARACERFGRSPPLRTKADAFRRRDHLEVASPRGDRTTGSVGQSRRHRAATGGAAGAPAAHGRRVDVQPQRRCAWSILCDEGAWAGPPRAARRSRWCPHRSAREGAFSVRQVTGSGGKINVLFGGGAAVIRRSIENWRCCSNESCSNEKRRPRAASASGVHTSTPCDRGSRSGTPLASVRHSTGRS
jgi:hypothetical protein